VRGHWYDFRSLLETYADTLCQKRKLVSDDNVGLNPESSPWKRICFNAAKQPISVAQLRREVEALVCPDVQIPGRSDAYLTSGEGAERPR
jgi:hypothetical protein